jgi:hypothetical protein
MHMVLTVLGVCHAMACWDTRGEQDGNDAENRRHPRHPRTASECFLHARPSRAEVRF